MKNYKKKIWIYLSTVVITSVAIASIFIKKPTDNIIDFKNLPNIYPEEGPIRTQPTKKQQIKVPFLNKSIFELHNEKFEKKEINTKLKVHKTQYPIPSIPTLTIDILINFLQNKPIHKNQKNYITSILKNFNGKKIFIVKLNKSFSDQTKLYNYWHQCTKKSIKFVQDKGFALKHRETFYPCCSMIDSKQHALKIKKDLSNPFVNISIISLDSNGRLLFF